MHLTADCGTIYTWMSILGVSDISDVLPGVGQYQLKLDGVSKKKKIEVYIYAVVIRYEYGVVV